MTDPRLKKLFLKAIKRGDLSVSEVADYLGIDRVTVWRWCKARRIDADRCRSLAVARVIRQMIGDPKATKRVEREDAADALETWNWKHGAPRLEQGEELEAERIDQRH